MIRSVVFVLLFSAAASAQQPQTNAVADTTPAGKVDQLMATLDPEGPGLAVAVVQDGKVIYENAWGLANLTHIVPFTAATRSNIGSTTKQFTSFALLLLEGQGKLSLDDDVRKHIPELPDLKQKVTIRHLLTHTSGYREFYNTMALAGRQFDEGDYIDRAEIIALVQRQPALQNTPGAEYNYNNTGYALASMIVERASGKSFPEFLHDHVFRPMGMSSSIVRATPGQIVRNSAQGYVAATGGYREARDLSASMGAGGIYSTVGDLAKWMTNFGTARVGARGFFERMSAPNVLMSGDTSEYALGLMIDRWRGLTRVRHPGVDVAHRSALNYFPQLRGGVTVQANSAAINAARYADRIAEIFFGKALSADVPIAMAVQSAVFDTARFDLYAGRYALDAAPGFITSFTRRGDKFYTQAMIQPEVEIKPTSDSTFAITTTASVTFHRGAGGIVNHITISERGNHHRGTRVGTVGVVRPDLAPFAGRYFSDELATLYEISDDQNSLVLTARRLDTVKLTHVEGDRFTGHFPVGTLVFERNVVGNVTGMRVGNGRTRDVLFKRVD